MKKLLIPVLFLMLSIYVLAGDIEKNDSLVVRAIRSNETIKIDGVLFEDVWQNGHAFTRFTQSDPIEGAKPTEQTEVRVAYDDKALFIGARMYDSNPDSIMPRLARRDVLVSSDYFALFIDPYNDKRSGFYFAVTAAGTQLDGVLMNDDWDDDSWDGVWESNTNIDENGWTAEMRIPFSQLRFHRKDKYVWGVNFAREIQRKNEQDLVVFTPKDGSGFVSRFINLVGVENISSTRQVEFLPYVRTKAEYTHPDAGNPFHDGSRYLPGMGLDVKLGIGNNLTLDATLNPDFGQVEVDPAVVNLTDIETYFTEKRPFFIEGSNTFRFGRGGANSFYGLSWSSPTFFYSRRIGRSPQGSIPDYDFANLPEGTKILGAGKLTGKTGNNWNVGALGAVTAREKAELQLGNNKFHSEVEPLSFYSVLRMQKEFPDGKQGLGFISTLVNRRFDDIVLKDQLNSESYAAGIDGWTFFDKEKVWVLTGWTGFSQVRGNKERMRSLQNSSSHYFQRPDAGHVEIDSLATSLTGWAGRLWINKQKGNVIFNAALGAIHPKFDVHDLGFIGRTDIINGHIIGGYKWTKPGKVFRRAELHLAIFGTWDFGGFNTWKGIFQYGELQFLNYHGIWYYYAYNPQSYNNRRTRGGPMTLNLAGHEAEIEWYSDKRKKWIFGLAVGGGNYPMEKYFSIEPCIEWNPADNVSLSISPEYATDVITAQWIDAFNDPTATLTFGKRYVFAKIDQRSLSANIRLNWTFTPKLSLQIYAQPLIASGDYYDFKELAKPKTYDFNIFGEGESTFDAENYIADPDGDGPAEPIELSNPDFNFKSLRGNTVLRWEYSPGSTLYFVWTQRRSDVEEIGDFQFKRSVNRLLNARGDNIFMIKMTYWFGV
ncbi:carbohydrate binding family 9 domain-containing protein [candidate division KSB1 bacterium]|nr:carbohydrate binding family 9 domain-containing protein [candidate division KSB1 bacterium]